MSGKLKRLVFLDGIFCALMIGYKLLPTSVVALLLISYVMLNIVRLNSIFGQKKAIIYTSILIIPLSFVSVMGTSTEVFPISWFHLLIGMSVVVVVLAAKSVDKRYFLYQFLLIGFLLFNCLLQIDIGNAIKQVLMMVLFSFSFIIGKNLSVDTISNDEAAFVTSIYIAGAISVAFQVVIQYFVMNSFGIVLGEYTVYGTGVRTARAGLMGDYSFASLYIASGLLAIIIEYINKKTLKFSQFLIMALILATGVLLSTARTGLYALVIMLLIYMCLNLNAFKWQYLVFIGVVVIVAPYAISILSSSRGVQSLLDSSGRVENYIMALKSFEKHPLLGAGLGLQNFQNNTGLDIPHNFFIQYLAQTGIIGTLIIILPFARYISEIIRSKNTMKWIFFMVLIGAMVIPDIINSRFLYAIIICSYVNMEEHNYYET